MNRIIDLNGRATVASAEGQAALDAGDTERAGKRFVEAGELLEREMTAAKEDETEHLLRFLAATQFYKGGRYRRALELAKKIKEAKLPASTRPLLLKFMKDVKDRSSSNYQARIEEQLQALWTAEDYSGILKLLQDHPYIVNPATLAYLRAICCETLGKYRPAALFFADAARQSQDPKVLAALAPLPLNLAAQGKIEEAWEYACAQVELFPNAVSYAIASCLRYHQARQAEGDAKTALFKEQMIYIARAREEYARLAPAHQHHPKIKDAIGLGYEAAAHALYLSGDKQGAREACDAAINFDPTSPNVWTLRGVLISSVEGVVQPNEEAAAAFKKAIDLGDKTVAPYSYLAFDALHRGAFSEALDWSQQALDRMGDKRADDVRSTLFQYIGISLERLGTPRAEIEKYFKKAVEIAPHNIFAKSNYLHFQKSEPLETPPNRFEQSGTGFNLDRLVDHMPEPLVALHP